MKREDAVRAVEAINAAAALIDAVAKSFRESLDEPGSRPMIVACGHVIASMHGALLRPIFAEFPDLEAESSKRGLVASTED